MPQLVAQRRNPPISDVGLVPGAARDAHLGASTGLALECADEVGVEDGEGQQRTAEHHDEVEHIGVDDAVDD